METDTEWMARPQQVACKTFYEVYRMNSKVVETRGGYYESRIDAERLAATLNAEEKNK